MVITGGAEVGAGAVFPHAASAIAKVERAKYRFSCIMNGFPPTQDYKGGQKRERRWMKTETENLICRAVKWG
jgi:hypothetical protein